MTYWSRLWRISCGVGSLLRSARAASDPAPSSRMMSLQSSMHSSQMNTDGPAMSLRTSCWLLPQKEQYRSLSPEDFSAIQRPVGRSCWETLRALHPLVQDLIDDAIFLRRFRGQEIVAFGVESDLLDRLSGMQRQQPVEPLAQRQDVLGMDLDVGCLALESAQRLMDHHGRIGQHKPLALGTCRQQKRAHRGRH